MNTWKLLPLAVCVAGAMTLGGCSALVGGAAGGAAGYEYSNKRAMDQLDADYKAGKISKSEYLKRKAEIEKNSGNVVK